MIKQCFEICPYSDDVTTRTRARMRSDWPNALLEELQLKTVWVSDLRDEYHHLHRHQKRDIGRPRCALWRSNLAARFLP